MGLGIGDRVYLLDGRGNRHFLRLSDGLVRVGGLGLVDSSRMLGGDEGMRLEVVDREYVVLRPGVLEEMESVERGAQVVTPKDAADIVLRTSLSPGDVVIESGAGSGALTLALLNAVAPDGRVISVEAREDFASKARHNVSMSPHAALWECVIGDSTDVSLDVGADAVVLDMPTPWDALDNLIGNLRGGGRFCAYVPTVNQLERVMVRMRELDMVETYSIETLQRQMVVHEGGVRPSFDMLGHTGYMAFGRRTV